jgi:hypothetical protein
MPSAQFAPTQRTRSSADGPSLALPTPDSLTERRVRPPRRPRLWELWWALWSVYAMVAAAQMFAEGWPAHASIDAIYAVIYWCEWHAARDRRPGLVELVHPAVWFLAIPLWPALTLIGVH